MYSLNRLCLSHVQVPYSCCVMDPNVESPGTPDDVTNLTGCYDEAKADPPPENFEYLHYEVRTYYLSYQYTTRMHKKFRKPNQIRKENLINFHWMCIKWKHSLVYVSYS